MDAMIRNIVVGYDDTRCAQVAVEQAVDIAEVTDGRVHLVLITEQMAPLWELGPANPEAPPVVREYESPEDRWAADELDQSTAARIEAATTVCEKVGVPHTVTRLYGHPTDRLVRRGWLADLMVIGRGPGACRTEPGKLGPIARQVLLRTVTPTLLCDIDHVPLTRALLLYEQSEAGGRALARAGELCSLMNMELDVIVAHPDRRAGEKVLGEAGFALRSFHVDGDSAVFAGTPADAVRSEATIGKAGLVIMPQPPKPVWSWQTPSALRSATALSGAMVMVVP